MSEKHVGKTMYFWIPDPRWPKGLRYPVMATILLGIKVRLNGFSTFEGTWKDGLIQIRKWGGELEEFKNKPGPAYTDAQHQALLDDIDAEIAKEGPEL